MSDTSYILQPSDLRKLPVVVQPYTANGYNLPNDSSAGLYPTATQADTSLVFLGKGSFDYGEPIQTNLMHILENFASPESPLAPMDGQIWFNTTTDLKQRGLYYMDSGSWKLMMHVGTTAPMESDLDMNGYKIINLAPPSDPNDAVNLQYADDKYAFRAGDTFTGPVGFNEPIAVKSSMTVTGNTSTFSGTSISLTNGAKVDTAAGSHVTMNSGNLTLSGTGNLSVASGYTVTFGGTRLRNIGVPVDVADAVRKDYVDGLVTGTVSGYLPLTGGTLTGPLELAASANFSVVNGNTIDMGNNRVEQVLAPVDNTDATNKKYVDDGITVLKTYADDTFLKLTGGLITGTVRFSTDSQLISGGIVDFSRAKSVLIDYGTY